MELGGQLRDREPDWADNHPHIIGLVAVGVIAVVVLLTNYFGGSFHFPIP